MSRHPILGLALLSLAACGGQEEAAEAPAGPAPPKPGLHQTDYAFAATWGMRGDDGGITAVPVQIQHKDRRWHLVAPVDPAGEPASVVLDYDAKVRAAIGADGVVTTSGLDAPPRHLDVFLIFTAAPWMQAMDEGGELAGGTYRGPCVHLEEAGQLWRFAEPAGVYDLCITPDGLPLRRTDAQGQEEFVVRSLARQIGDPVPFARAEEKLGPSGAAQP